MRKHAIQLADYIDKQRDERKQCLIEYQKQLAKNSRAQEESNKNLIDDYNRLKTNSCESITNAATLVLRAALNEDLDPENVSGCFGRVSSAKSIRPPSSPTKRRQALLDPIRRWNSFHMRDRKTNSNTVRSFEQFRRDYTRTGGNFGEEQTSSPSMAASGLMGAVPRVLALRNEYLPSETVITEHQNRQSRKQLSVDFEPVEKARTLSQGDVGKTFSCNLSEAGKEGGMTLTRQITRELLLAAKRNSSKELFDDSKTKESGEDLSINRHRTRSEGDDEEKRKTVIEISKKSFREKTKESYTLTGVGVEKLKRQKDTPETDAEGKPVTSSPKTSTSDAEFDEDQSEW